MEYAVRLEGALQIDSTTLHELHRAGADVPFPIALKGDAVLMEYIGDETCAAPRLAQVELARDEAKPLFERILRNIGLWLDLDRIHGDLSPYNILYWNGAVTIIDFPHAIESRFNPLPASCCIEMSLTYVATSSATGSAAIRRGLRRECGALTNMAPRLHSPRDVCVGVDHSPKRWII